MRAELQRFFVFGSPERYSRRGLSRIKYSLPVKMDQYLYYPRSPEHTGRFACAVDIVVPNPMEQETIIYAPASGVIKYAVLDNTKWGPEPEMREFLNYINVSTRRHEFFEIAHLAPLENVPLFIGRHVEKGEPIARAALNGRITVTNGIPDSHVHILVGEWLESRDFRSLEIRWDHENELKPLY